MFQVEDTKTQNGLSLHIGHMKKTGKKAGDSKGTLFVNETVYMTPEPLRRMAITQNHSVTHLMHESLRRVLGDHVVQKGSLQDSQRTRFDISQPVAMTDEQIAEVEQIVRDEIQANTLVETRVMPIEEARESGAMALFGEKYDEEGRVLAMGRDDFSIELCGGTHVKKTGEIEKFKIVSESAVSAGIRRIEAVTGTRVDAYEQGKEAEQQAVLDRLMSENKRLREELSTLGGQINDDVPGDSTDIEKQNKKLQKEISELRRMQGAESSADDIKEIAGAKFIGKVLDGFPPKDLKPMADDLKEKLGSGVIVLVATNEDKASIVVGVTDDLTSKINAVDLVKVGSEALGGKGGGGRPDMAQAGGPNADAANDALSAIEKSLAG